MSMKAHSQADYRRALQQLLPPGRLFDIQPGSNLDGVLNAIASSFANVDAAAVEVVDEAHPETVLQMLPEMNAEMQLPDDCAPADQTVIQQRGAIIQKMTQDETVTLSFLVAAAAKIGFPVTAVKRHSRRYGTLYGQNVYGTTYGGSDWNYAIEIHAPLNNVEQRIFGDVYGLMYSTWGNQLLECTLNGLIGVGKLLFIYS